MKLLQNSKNGILYIAIIGELGHHEAQQLIRQMETSILLHPAEPVVLDLSQMTFMDSSGLAVVLHLHRSLYRLGRALTVSGAAKQPMRVFQAAGLPKIIRFEERE